MICNADILGNFFRFRINDVLPKCLVGNGSHLDISSYHGHFFYHMFILQKYLLSYYCAQRHI